MLCGPNTMVYDTLHDSINFPYRDLVFVGEFSKYVSKGINHLAINAIYVKSTATLELRPAITQNSLLHLIVEPGATILNYSGFNFYDVDTCSSLIFPSGCLYTGLEENSDTHSGAFRIWPTPAADVLNLHYSADASGSPTEILIYNSLGQMVQTQRPVFENNKTSLLLSELKNGIYFLELKNGSSILSRKRFVFAK